MPMFLGIFLTFAAIKGEVHAPPASSGAAQTGIHTRSSFTNITIILTIRNMDDYPADSFKP